MNKTLFIMGMAGIVMASCKNDEVTYDASGVFEATEVIVSAKAQGEILSLNIEEGDEVKAGQVVGEIDTVQLGLKKQQLSSVQQSTDSRQLDINAQIAATRQQIQNLQREKARFEALLQDKAATQKQVDDISYQISVAEKQVQALENQLSASNQSLSDQSRSTGAQISQVDQQISDAHITSTATGCITNKFVEKGEYAVPGKALFKVSDIQHIYLRAYITADQLNSIKLNQEVTVYADQGTSDRKAYKGRVTWIASKAEFTPKTIQTRDERANLVYAIKISIQNDGLVKEGMYGDVKF